LRSDDASHDNDEDDDGGGGGEDAMVTRLVVLRATDWRVEELLVLATYPFFKQIAGWCWLHQQHSQEGAFIRAHPRRLSPASKLLE